MMFGYYGSDMTWMAIVMPLLWIALIGITAWAVMRLMGDNARAARGSGRDCRVTPQEILDRRFASGEIDAQEHLAARQHLKAAAEADPAARR
jgi:putative membrane protein